MLTCFWEAIRNDEVHALLSAKRFEWKFNVERAPWRGGFSERLVGSAKQALKKTLGRTRYSVDELTTILTEVEAVLNSRPITHVYPELGETEPLCPAYFLAGKRLTALLQFKSSEMNDIPGEYLRRFWIHRQGTLKAFWRRWTKEYLMELRDVNNTRGHTRNPITEGDIALLHETMLPRQL